MGELKGVIKELVDEVVGRYWRKARNGHVKGAERAYNQLLGIAMLYHRVNTTSSDPDEIVLVWLAERRGD